MAEYLAKLGNLYVKTFVYEYTGETGIGATEARRDAARFATEAEAVDAARKAWCSPYHAQIEIIPAGPEPRSAPEPRPSVQSERETWVASESLGRGERRHNEEEFDIHGVN